MNNFLATMHMIVPAPATISVLVSMISVLVSILMASISVGIDGIGVGIDGISVQQQHDSNLAMTSDDETVSVVGVWSLGCVLGAKL